MNCRYAAAPGAEVGTSSQLCPAMLWKSTRSAGAPVATKFSPSSRKPTAVTARRIQAWWRRVSQCRTFLSLAEVSWSESLRACFAKLRVEKKLYALRYEKDLSYRSL